MPHYTKRRSGWPSVSRSQHLVNTCRLESETHHPSFALLRVSVVWCVWCVFVWGAGVKVLGGADRSSDRESEERQCDGVETELSKDL